MQRISILLLALLISACQPPRPMLKDTDGKTVKLTGKCTVLNYWATWCVPCAKEIPELNAFYQSHQNTNIQLVGVNLDMPSNTIELKQYIAKLGVAFPTLDHDPAKALELGEIRGIPSTFLIDASGRVKQKLLGIQTKLGLEKILSKEDLCQTPAA